MGWLEDFVEHTKYGEAPPRVMKWVGVSTIAGALRRKVWIDEFIFQWTPNFYILLVGDPGILKKSTSSRLGMRILEKVEGIDFGPQIVTWEQLITHMADSTQTYKVNGRDFVASCVTIELSEFGTLFDPTNRQMVDNLTDLWDSKLTTLKKETKTNGCDEVQNPWINIIAGVAPGWLDDNFSGKYVRSGYASRVIYVWCDIAEVGVKAHPSRSMPDMAAMREREEHLLDGLKQIADYAGPFKLTEEAYKWSEDWYSKLRKKLREDCDRTERSLYSRGQSHLMKLAMVISASRFKFPEIGVYELEEANLMLEETKAGVQQVFGGVGQSPTSKLARDIVEVLVREGEQTKKILYRKHFFRVVGINQFGEALESVKASGIVREVGNVNDPILRVM